MWNTPGEKVTTEELLQQPLFDGESLEAVAWIASQMEARNFPDGEVLVRQGDPAEHFLVLLKGEIHFRRAEMDEILIAEEGEPLGVLPFSRLKTWRGIGWAVSPVRLAFMEAGKMRELVYRAPVLAQKLVSQMTDRAREFTRIEESSNRLLALGKLAAGLAHELNNPASAAVRSSSRLREVLMERRKHVLILRSEVLPPGAGQIMNSLADSIAGCSVTPGVMDALERSDLENAMSDWLEETGIATDLASPLVDAGLSPEQIRPLAAIIAPEWLTHSLRILVADHEILCLTRELEEASVRISDLVQAVKSYSYMDQSPTAEVDIEQGIDVTLRMFHHQLKYGIEVSRKFAGNLPKVTGNGSALNQIWTNLIDNAIDAVNSLPKDQHKLLSVRTAVEPEGVLVEIGDNGPGIPPDVQNRMFEPFFTTKPVGEGTGLGLDIVQRIIRNHKASIRMESQPGRTIFQVRLPLEGGRRGTVI
jgi:signal transduction histidine kinase